MAGSWHGAASRDAYQVVIIGGGGHGPAAAGQLAKEHGNSNVGVIERSDLGSGNAGRYTTIIRPNHRRSGNDALCERSIRLREGVEQNPNYSTMAG